MRNSSRVDKDINTFLLPFISLRPASTHSLSSTLPKPLEFPPLFPPKVEIEKEREKLTSLLNSPQKPPSPTSPTKTPCSSPSAPSTFLNSALTFSNKSLFLPISKHLAPSLAKRRAISAPMPRDAPVMMQRFPARGLGCCVLVVFRRWEEK